MREQRTFEGLLNADDEINVLPPNQYVRAVNFRIGTTQDGATSRLESIRSNAIIANPYLPSTGVNTTIGSCADETTGYLIWFNHNSAGTHAIYLLDKTTVYKVLLNTQVSGGLNFSDALLITAKVVNGLLVWTDNNSEPKAISLYAALKLNHSSFPTAAVAYTAPIKYESTTLIKRPPVYPLDVEKITDGSYTANNIENDAFQFLYFYEYRTFQYSALSAYSKLVPFSFAGESNNAVDVSLSLSETIDDDCLRVHIVVRHSTTGGFFIFKTFDKSIAADLTAITAHNSGTTPLSVRFYNDNLGVSLDKVAASTPFHSVARRVKTIEEARGRLFLGNLLEGYNSPPKTSLTLTAPTTNTGSTGTFAGQWNYVSLHANFVDSFQDTYNYPYVTSSTAPSPVYYFSAARNSTNWNGGTHSVPATVNLSDGIGFATLADLVEYLKVTQYPSSSLTVGSPTWRDPYETYIINTTGNGTGGVAISSYSSTQLTQFFKSAGTYEATIAFYDRFRRKCGAVRGAKVTIPVRTYGQTVFTATINWALSNTDRLVEIPEWAYYYQIHITRNLSTRHFVQARSAAIKYAVKNDDGTYTYGTSWSQSTYAIAVDISKLTGFGMGYTYAAGDFLRIYPSAGGAYHLSVLGQEGNYVLVKPTDIGDVNTVDSLFELYTPYKPSTSEPFYETGPVYAVASPGTTARAYSTLAGIINGDSYALQRTFNTGNTYVVEAMSPNDSQWQQWATNTGWINLVTDLGETAVPSAVQFSDTFIEGTKTNGINIFQPLNREVLPIEMGGVEKLQLTSKVEGEGTVMLAIGKNQTASIYLGEANVTYADGSSNLAVSKGVIGQVNVLKGDYGTINPESVVLSNGNVWWMDVRRGCFVQYSLNGLDDISKSGTGVFKLGRVSKAWCDKFLSMSPSDFTAIGSRPFIQAGVDVFHGEVLFSLPKLAATAPKGVLADYVQDTPSYVNPVFPYDVLDYQGKTMVFKIAPSRWAYEIPIVQENWTGVGSELFSFHAGALYKHNSPVSFNNFNGVAFRSQIMFPFNENNANKEFHSLVLESNIAPEWTHLRVEYPFVQSSDLVATEWRQTEEIWTADVKRDRLSPNVSGTYDQKLHTGDIMRGKAMLCLLQFPNTAVWVRLAAVNYQNSSTQ